MFKKTLGALALVGVTMAGGVAEAAGGKKSSKDKANPTADPSRFNPAYGLTRTGDKIAYSIKAGVNCYVQESGTGSFELARVSGSLGHQTWVCPGSPQRGTFMKFDHINAPNVTNPLPLNACYFATVAPSAAGGAPGGLDAGQLHAIAFELAGLCALNPVSPTSAPAPVSPPAPAPVSPPPPALPQESVNAGAQLDWFEFSLTQDTLPALQGTVSARQLDTSNPSITAEYWRLPTNFVEPSSALLTARKKFSVTNTGAPRPTLDSVTAGDKVVIVVFRR